MRRGGDGHCDRLGRNRDGFGGIGAAASGSSTSGTSPTSPTRLSISDSANGDITVAGGGGAALRPFDGAGGGGGGVAPARRFAAGESTGDTGIVVRFGSATGAAARMGAGVGAGAGAVAARTEGGAAAAAIAASATALDSYFFVRLSSTSLTIAFSVSCTPMPVVATDS